MPMPLTCPHCKNPIYDEEALLCHFCGGSLGRGSDGAIGRMRGAGNKWIWVTVAVLLVIAALITLLI